MKAPANENEWIRRLTTGWKTDRSVLTGVGDDCAVIEEVKGHYSLLKTDAVVEGVHFLKQTPGQWVGHKALARVLSDFAAMGGKPRYALITIGISPETSWQRAQSIYRGLSALARRWKVNLVGGETTRAQQLFISIAAQGETRGFAPVLRSTAQAGDDLWVTGRLGGTQRAKHLRFEPRLKEGEWLARRGMARAMMDLSDGLAADLPRLALASRVSFCLERERIPRARGASVEQALSDGEDYELLFAAAPRWRSVLEKKWPFSVSITRIGSLRARAEGETILTEKGYDHLKQS